VAQSGKSTSGKQANTSEERRAAADLTPEQVAEERQEAEYRRNIDPADPTHENPAPILLTDRPGTNATPAPAEYGEGAGQLHQ
jgi:hypothetical protein